MRDFRMDCNTTEHYSSFEEMAKAWKCRPVNKVTKDMKKLKDQQENFYKRDKKRTCSACGNPMTLVAGTSVMACTNPDCKGIRYTKPDAEGKEIVNYAPSYCLLDGVAIDIANNIFSVTV